MSFTTVLLGLSQGGGLPKLEPLYEVVRRTIWSLPSWAGQAPHFGESGLLNKMYLRWTPFLLLPTVVPTTQSPSLLLRICGDFMVKWQWCEIYGTDDHILQCYADLVGKSGANHPSIYFLSSHQEVMRVKSKSSESVEISGGCGNADSDGGELTRCNGSTAVVANSTTHWVFSRSFYDTLGFLTLSLKDTLQAWACRNSFNNTVLSQHPCCPLNTT